MYILHFKNQNVYDCENKVVSCENKMINLTAGTEGQINCIVNRTRGILVTLTICQNSPNRPVCVVGWAAHLDHPRGPLSTLRVPPVRVHVVPPLKSLHQGRELFIPESLLSDLSCDSEFVCFSIRNVSQN